MKGQSLIEMVFAVGVIVLVLSGVVALLVTSMAARSKSMSRSQATRLAELVVEELGKEKRNEAESFWGLGKVDGETMAGFENYTYSVGFSVIDNVDGCRDVGVTVCAEAMVTVNWGNNEQYSLKRFFSRN